MKKIFKPTKTVSQLAKKYKVSEAVIRAELKKGIKVELEHTKYKKVARTIALHHLDESLYYYGPKFKKFEKSLKSK